LALSEPADCLGSLVAVVEVEARSLLAVVADDICARLGALPGRFKALGDERRPPSLVSRS
jgi:hypothetical protein